MAPPAESLREGSVTQTWDAPVAHPRVHVVAETARPAALSRPQTLRPETVSTAGAARVVGVNRLPLAASGTEAVP